jgi:excisionase family DNA binding protein
MSRSFAPFLREKTNNTLRSVNRSLQDIRAGRSEFLSRYEVSKLLGVSPNTVTRWARQGKLACQVTLGGHHRFERTVVENLLRTLTRGGSVAE